MNILFFIENKSPDRDQSQQANELRTHGHDVKFVYIPSAMDRDCIECDQIITNSKAVIKKYKKPVFSSDVGIEDEIA